jgi:hypothetical protein
MPHHDEDTSNTQLNRPVTRHKNASAHPGTEAKRALSSRRDPEIIQKEKLDRKARKDAKDLQKAKETARKETTQHHIEELRAQQATELGNKELNLRCRQPKGKKRDLQ